MKARLYNKVGKDLLRERLMNEDFKRTTVSFYKYFKIADVQSFRDELYIALNDLNVFGRIYVAAEGVNAQISVPEYNWEKFEKALFAFDDLNKVPFKIAVEDDGKSFYKLIVRIREKIVADGLNDDTFDSSDIGNYLDAKEFNEVTKDPNTILIDMRNHYETEVGHFNNAVCLDADTFRDALPMALEEAKGSEDKKIVLYCTGGIRCEKASAYFKHKGFKDVNQLKGGIIDYAHQVKDSDLESEFKGSNFVFDERLGEHISGEIISECHQCGAKCETHVNCSNDECHLLFIQCDECKTKYSGACSPECQHIASLSKDEQRKLRKGKLPKSDARNIFKSRLRPNLREHISKNPEYFSLKSESD